MSNGIRDKTRTIYNAILYVLKKPMSSRTCSNYLGIPLSQANDCIKFLHNNGYIKKLDKKVENRQNVFQYKTIIESIESDAKRKTSIREENHKRKTVIGNTTIYRLSNYDYHSHPVNQGRTYAGTSMGYSTW